MFEESGIILDVAPMPLIKLILSILLGLVIGLEREWSEKESGIRTTPLIAVFGVVMTFFPQSEAILIGFIVPFLFIYLLGSDGDDIRLTTSITITLVYSIGVLVGLGLYVESVSIIFFMYLLLISKEELTSIVGSASQEELRGAAIFGILAFVIFPILPEEPIDPWGVAPPRLIWGLIVAISGIGFLNYIILQIYSEKGTYIVGFFGGLVNSTAVIVSLSSQLKEITSKETVISSVLLANGAMALRNVLLLLFFVTEVWIHTIPLLSITLVGLLYAIYTITDVEDQKVDVDEINTPFELVTALKFGMLFLLILVFATILQEILGDAGFLFATFTAGLISSGSATTTAITLYIAGDIEEPTLISGVFVGIIGSLFVKLFLVYKVDKDLVKTVFVYTIGTIIVCGSLLGSFFVLV